MSLIPHILDEHPLDWAVHPRDFWTPRVHSLLRSFSTPLGYFRNPFSHWDELEKKLHFGKDGFEVNLDVEHFKPEEINVKTIDNFILVEAKHEERKETESSYISRQIVRRYNLPEGFKLEDVTSKLSSDGILTIKCPKSESLEAKNARKIEIQLTGPARLSIGEKGEKKNEDILENQLQETTDIKPEQKTAEQK